MKNELNLERRVQKDLVVSDDLYLEGLFDIVQWLLCDLESYIKDENRFFGIMPIYFRDIKKSVSSFNQDCTEDECNIYGKIFYLFKPIIIKEFVKLRLRRLSNADCLIVMIKRILDLLEDEGNKRESLKLKDFQGVNAIITKMFDRIKNNNKKSTLKTLIDSFRTYIDLGSVGRVCIDEFSMKNEISRRESFRSPIKDNGTIYSETKGTTVWKGE